MAKGTIKINADMCKGCTLCVIACPPAVIQIVRDDLNAQGYYPAALVDPAGACTGCGLCAVACPDVCITVWRHVPAPAHLTPTS